MDRSMQTAASSAYPAAGDARRKAAPAQGRKAADVVRSFDLLRWFSIVSFVAVFLFAVTFAAMLSHFLRREILQRDAMLTSQFIVSIAESQLRQARLGAKVSVAQILDERVDFPRLGVDSEIARSIRQQVYEHLRVLPDALLATVFARDRQIIWSTNKALIGMVASGNRELEEAFASRVMVSTEHGATDHHDKPEQQFVNQEARFFVENYVPLRDHTGRVVAVVEIYKEPISLQQTIRRGTMLVWACTGLGAVFLYLALFSIMRRADDTLQEQKRRLLESEALCVIGEMSAAVAHGIRNPLASIRSSAELALDSAEVVADGEQRKYAADIITQVDRLGKWVRDLLMFSRPMQGENQVIDLLPLVEDCLHNFETQLGQSGVACRFVRPETSLPAVVGNRALVTQALASVLANAIEAMPRGGDLKVELKPEPAQRRLAIVVADSGVGMSPAQLALVFKPFYTTKRKGIGLGMALVKRVMERSGGDIALESNEGQGTRVYLRFPITRP